MVTLKSCTAPARTTLAGTRSPTWSPFSTACRSARLRTGRPSSVTRRVALDEAALLGRAPGLHVRQQQAGFLAQALAHDLGQRHGLGGDAQVAAAQRPAAQQRFHRAADGGRRQARLRPETSEEEFKPATRCSASTSGPPEKPGYMTASVCK